MFPVILVLGFYPGLLSFLVIFLSSFFQDQVQEYLIWQLWWNSAGIPSQSQEQLHDLQLLFPFSSVFGKAGPEHLIPVVFGRFGSQPLLAELLLSAHSPGWGAAGSGTGRNQLLSTRER